jgi:thioredoxin-like negative regulator of GroEL
VAAIPDRLQLVRDMLDNAAAALAGEQFYDDVPHDAPAADTLAALARVSDARHELAAIAARLEDHAHTHYASFSAIGRATGTTAQSAQERHARRNPDPDPTPPARPATARPVHNPPKRSRKARKR